MCYGDDFGKGAAQLATITGPPPLMPIAAYGVWYSGCCIPSLYTQDAVNNEVLSGCVERFRADWSWSATVQIWRQLSAALRVHVWRVQNESCRRVRLCGSRV
jgi:hypothetical protein